MAVKFDKDMLIKHRFWVLLGVSVPLVITAIFILITAVSADNEAKRKKLESTRKGLTPGGSGPKVVQQLEEVAKERKAKETVVHEEAFKTQEVLFTWPLAMEDHFDFRNGFFATEVKIVSAPRSDDSWPADDESTRHGKVINVDEDTVVVAGKDKKETAFHRTYGVKVSRLEKKEGDRDQWGSIREGDFLAITFYKSKYFYDPLTDSEQRMFVRNDEGYRSQLDSILRIVDPVDKSGEGTVQYRGWFYQRGRLPHEDGSDHKFFTYVTGDENGNWKADAPIYEEAWLAQEDLWIQRELFRIIREANDSVGKLRYRGGDPKKVLFVNPQGDDKSKPATFGNHYYELKFEWEGPKLFVTASNQLARRQKLDMHFRVRFNKNNNIQLSTEKILVGGEPLEPKGAKGDTRKVEIALEPGGVQRTGIYEVEQVINWETAPVKRIDEIAIGWPANEVAHSHRTFPQGSVPYKKVEKKEEKKAADAGSALGQPMGGFDMKGFGGFGGGNTPQADVGVNGVLKDRYIEVSEQSRRVPVGLALIVDQDQVDRVLTSFNNSKLRFLTTQVLLNRYPNSVRPQLLVAGGKEGEGQPAPPMPMSQPMGGLAGSTPTPMSATSPMTSASGPPKGVGGLSGSSGYSGSMRGPPGVMSMPMGQPTGFAQMAAPAAATTGGSEELENNVEMVIYGIVTLYERYPKRKIALPEVK